MDIDNFTKKIEKGDSTHWHYTGSKLEGLVSIWFNEGKVILTWEESPVGQVDDESTYTKDEHHQFNDLKELFEFMDANKLEVEKFK